LFEKAFLNGSKEGKGQKPLMKTYFRGMKKTYFWAAVLGMLAVLLGAAGAHALQTKISPVQLGYWDKAVHYQFWHVLAILLCFSLEEKQSTSYRWPVRLFYAGIILFSGSLYGLALKDYHAVPAFILGPLTPLGGLCWTAAWLMLATRLWKTGR